jgi:hypothetical protein
MPRRRTIALLAVAVVLAGGVAAVALSGGLADAKTVATPLAKAGSTVKGDFVDVTVHGAELSDRRPGDFGPVADGKVYLIVHATVLDRDPDPSPSRIGEVRATVTGLLDQRDSGEDRDPRTGTTAVAFNPGVPTDVDYIWTLPASKVKDGQKFWVGVYQRKHIEQDPVFGDSALTGPQAMAVVDLRMEDSR